MIVFFSFTTLCRAPYPSPTLSSCPLTTLCLDITWPHPTTCYPDLSSPMFHTSPYLYSILTPNSPSNYTHHPSLSIYIYIFMFRGGLGEETMEVAMMMEVEDDVFFADLNRQISLLITDDEDDHGYYCPPISSYPTAVSTQTFSRTEIYPSAQPQYQFDQTSYKTTTADQSKGTGVFIPKSSQFSSRRRSKHQTKTNNYSSYNNYNYNYNSSYYRQQQELPSPAYLTPKSC